MIAFLDSSVLLRKLFGEPNDLSEWEEIGAAYASRLLPLEMGRVIDRARLAGQINDDEVVALHQESRILMRSIEILALTETILDRATGAMPTVLGALDSIHLVTALELASRLDEPLVLATHDEQLARAARAFGLDVCGC